METKKENLEERLEFIRIRNEEIEKKHREAEEDRLMALKENAMVETKTPSWPRTHKYDNIEFDYDVEKDVETQKGGDAPVPDMAKKKEYKKFANGDGPPPDPAYNFLADKERDGEEKAAQDLTNVQNRKPRNSDNFNRKPSSFRGQNPGSNNYSGQARRGNKNDSRNNRNHGDYNDRKTDERRSQREPGNWRKERKPSDEKVEPTPPSPTNSNSSSRHNQTQQKLPQEDALITEKRGNIMISVSKDGEIKSVKLTSPPAQAGTGRVGLPRAITKQQQYTVENRSDKSNSNRQNNNPAPKQVEAKKFSVQNRIARPFAPSVVDAAAD